MFDPEEKNRKGTLYDRTELRRELALCRNPGWQQPGRNLCMPSRLFSSEKSFLFAEIQKLLAFHRVPAISTFVEL